MNIIIVSNYYPPDLGAAANRISNLAQGLVEYGNKVDVICPLANYPKGKVFDEYKGKFYVKESLLENLTLHRFWILPSVSKNPFIRIFSMLSFAISHLGFISSIKTIRKSDWIIVQNSPLLVSFSSVFFFKKIFKRKIALNVSDLWPLSAFELGAIKKGNFYKFLEFIELYNYRNSSLIIGQSQEILDHAKKMVDKDIFLYRNIQPRIAKTEFLTPTSNTSIKIIYAGLLGIAQGILELIKFIDFSKYNSEFHIYGDGNERIMIEDFIAKNPDRGVYFYGAISKIELDKKIETYDLSIVPLVREIKGAVPSKIFELAQSGVPIIFSGGGEGARIVNEYSLGYTVSPGDYFSIEEKIKNFSSLSSLEKNSLKFNCTSASLKELNFNNQLLKLIHLLNAIK